MHHLNILLVFLKHRFLEAQIASISIVLSIKSSDAQKQVIMLSHHQWVYSPFFVAKKKRWSQLWESWKQRGSAELEMWQKEENLIIMNNIN